MLANVGEARRRRPFELFRMTFRNGHDSAPSISNFDYKRSMQCRQLLPGGTGVEWARRIDAADCFEDAFRSRMPSDHLGDVAWDLVSASKSAGRCAVSKRSHSGVQLSKSTSAQLRPKSQAVKMIRHA
jgi:hypothetical protein